jgi:hypothetical protein
MTNRPPLFSLLFSPARRARACRAAAMLALACALVIGSSIAAAPAHAVNAIDLTPSFRSIVAGTQTTYDLVIDFDQASLGGGIVVQFNPGVAGFGGFTFDGGFPDNPALRLVCPGVAPGCAFFPGPGVLIAFANSVGISGPQTVGQLKLTGAGVGTTALTLQEDSSVAGPFVAVAGSFDAPTFTNATLEVTPSLVPLGPFAGPVAGLLCVMLGYGRVRRASAH